MTRTLTARGRHKIGERNLANIASEVIATTREETEAKVLREIEAEEYGPDVPLSDSDLLAALRDSPLGKRIQQQKADEVAAAKADADQRQAALLEQAREIIDALTPEFLAKRGELIQWIEDGFALAGAVNQLRDRLIAARSLSIKSGLPLATPERLVIEALRNRHLRQILGNLQAVVNVLGRV